MKALGFVYIMTNKRNGTLYTGVTNNLVRRVYEHKCGLIQGFTKKHALNLLVYYESFESIVQAIEREKQLKAGSRKKKLALIEALNPMWDDLYGTLI
jgi:putative endonuclease